MACDFEYSSGEYIDVGKTIMTNGLNGKAAASISAIIKPESLPSTPSVDYSIFGIETSTSGKGAFELKIANSDDKLFIAGRSETGDSYQTAKATDALIAGTEYHVGGYLDIANAKGRSYVNGAPQTEQSLTFGSAVFNTGTPDANNSIGCNKVGGNNFFDGIIAELGIWDVKLAANEWLMLVDRFSPLSVRPQNLIEYFSLVRSINGRILGIIGSANGTTAVPHPRVIYPSKPQM